MRPEDLTHHMQSVVIWVLVIVLGALFVLAVSDRRPAKRRRVKPSASAEDVLKERYAKGEIDHDTYARMLREVRA